MKIYVSSSWRNEYQQQVVAELRNQGHEVYDFMNPPKASGFAWSNISPDWEAWSTEDFRDALNHPVAIAGFLSDFDGMKWADACVLVLPCGRSAHTEAGWMAGAGKPVVVFTPIKQEPELMYKIYDHVTDSYEELSSLVAAIKIPNKQKPVIGDELLVIFDKLLPGKEAGPKLKAGTLVTLKNIHVDSMGFEHYDVGLPLTIEYVTSMHTGETLPKTCHWCAPHRFILWNKATMNHMLYVPPKQPTPSNG